MLETETFQLARMCRYRAPARALPGAAGGPRLDRQKHLPHQPAKGLLVLPRRNSDHSRTRSGHPRAGPLRNLHALHRRMPHCGTRALARGPLRAGRKTLHFLFHDRTAVRHSGTAPRRPSAITYSAATSVRMSARGTAKPRETASPARPDLFAPPLERLAALSETEFRQLFRDTPVTRSKYAGFLRNVAVAMGNSGLAKFRLPLRKLAASPDPLVSEHALWALERIGIRSSSDTQSSS